MNLWSNHVKRILVLLGFLVIVVIIVSVIYHFSSKTRRFWNVHVIQTYQDSHGNLPVSESRLIASWMSFDYINKLYDLPSDYLKNKLSISDVKYPNISIRAYVRSGHIDEVIFLKQVQDSVSQYTTK
jgi:hypothetical protein